MKTHKKEFLIILVIVVMAFAVGLYSSLHDKPEYVNQSGQVMVLPPEDYVIQTGAGSVTVGRSTFQEVYSLFPDGKILGMSTIYRPTGQPFFFEFSKKENILTVIQIEEKSLATARGINVGDSLDKVIAAYGDNYSSTNMAGVGMVDMSYGQSDKIIFKINNQVVTKIVVQHQVVK
ncbi:MAG: hypothetical protein ABRQ26_01050 [Syntrophomonadaceae bacterium]